MDTSWMVTGNVYIMVQDIVWHPVFTSWIRTKFRHQAYQPLQT